MSAPALPPSDPAPGRSPVPEGDGTPWERRASQRASLVADLTAEMEQEPITPFEIDEDTLAVFADRLVRRGWRRVTEDPDTIRLVATAMANADGWEVTWPAPGEEPEELHARYTTLASVALAAVLRGGEQHDQ